MMQTIPHTRDIVLIGGGHAHALVLRRWGMKPLPGARLTLINPGPSAPYTGMLPGFVAGHYRREELDIDLVRLARFAGARLILGKADALDREAKRVHVAGRGWIGYDLVSLDIGIHAEMPSLPGFAAHAVAAKPLERLAEAWTAHLERLRACPEAAEAGAAVIGGGVGGVELSMALAHGGAQAAGRRMPVTLIDHHGVLPELAPSSTGALRRRMEKMGVTVIERAEVAEVGPGAVRLADGRELRSAFTVGAAGARPYDWLGATGLELEDGFVKVGATLRSVSDPSVFAVGDCAHLTHAPRPKAGVFAVREAPVLHANLRAALGAGRWRVYGPQKDYLKLISVGEKAAVADRSGREIEGRWLWRWKNHIDQKFMDKFRDLPEMPAPALPRKVAEGVRDEMHGGQPVCGGCGAKVAQNALVSALADLPRRRADVETGAGDDAAVLVMGGTRQVVTTDHLRAVTEDPFVMARIAAHHALGDVWAMGAAPQAALPALTLPRLSPRLQARTLGEIMEAAGAVFADAGAEIVGGHTATGAELSIGFTVTGLLDGPAITLAGARPGDRLILTKPLGSGTIMAAEMGLKAKGAWVALALELMQQGQGAAATILRDAHAMTDVTGFGLAGHLLAMLDASGVGAELRLDDVPLMEGAAELAAGGVRSTLWSANTAAAARTTLRAPEDAPLLFDPQTSGGLLAAVAKESAEDLVRRLRDAGYPSAEVGEIVDGPPILVIR
ncbi:selenide, water dikinase SelD [Tranquillimonas alkanivorans]|uniref:Selenophosphate synthase n=1 Tax=Tranquillimonas alkanivorans TaxID=441119 RepID=A0A1I5R041_9RHOB|nr:selenide, water dikinase SelD [Tranquillimonas alkanivorans]SFP51691.1 selenophosphate synthase [Tranquillimonas alkanivorans]